MKSENRMERQKIIILVMNVVIGILCLVLFLLMMLAGQSLYERYSMPCKDFYFSGDINREDYVAMVPEYYRNVAEGFEKAPGMQEYYGVAKYYEAASLYKAYVATGDTARAEQEKAKMEAAVEEMGGWSVLQEDIRKQLGMQ